MPHSWQGNVAMGFAAHTFLSRCADPTLCHLAQMEGRCQSRAHQWRHCSWAPEPGRGSITAQSYPDSVLLDAPGLLPASLCPGSHADLRSRHRKGVCIATAEQGPASPDHLWRQEVPRVSCGSASLLLSASLEAATHTQRVLLNGSNEHSSPCALQKALLNGNLPFCVSRWLATKHAPILGGDVAHSLQIRTAPPMGSASAAVWFQVRVTKDKKKNLP